MHFYQNGITNCYWAQQKCVLSKGKGSNSRHDGQRREVGKRKIKKKMNEIQGLAYDRILIKKCNKLTLNQ